MGITDRIRDEMVKGPVTAGDISKRLQIPIAYAHSLLWQLVYRVKDAVIISTNPKVYSLLEAKPRKWRPGKYRGRPAGKITIPSYRWGSSRLG